MIERIDLESDLVEWECGSCKAPNACKASSLVAGGRQNETHDPRGNPKAIYLPKCECGAEDVVFRAMRATDKPLRLAINLLFDHLVTADKVHSNSRAVYLDEKRRGVTVSLPAGKRFDDLTGRAGRAAAAARDEAERPAREAAEQAARTALADAAAALKAAQEEALLAEAERRRAIILKARTNKRLGLPPGSEPPAEELEREAELARAPAP